MYVNFSSMKYAHGMSTTLNFAGWRSSKTSTNDIYLIQLLFLFLTLSPICPLHARNLYQSSRTFLDNYYVLRLPTTLFLTKTTKIPHFPPRTLLVF